MTDPPRRGHTSRRCQPHARWLARLAGSTIVAGDLAESISALKERHDEVHVIGSLGLVQSLLCFGLPVDVDADALADHLFTTFEGGFILCRALENPSAMHDQLRIFRQLVEALLATGRLERQPRRHRARRLKSDA